MPKTATKFYSSPLQGFTDFRFRQAFQQFFAGVDQYFAPYIRLDGKGAIKAGHKRDLMPENNQGLDLVPQLMAREAKDFLLTSKFLQDLGYSEVNWNLGCPYPMVAKRGLGSGLLAEPEQIATVLRQVQEASDIRISIKMRLGYEDPMEIHRVLPVLDDFELEHICIHPRIGKQLYKGMADPDAFEGCLKLSRHRILYNGDIDSVGAFIRLRERFPEVSGWMIGRGLIADPFLPSMIKSASSTYPEDWKERFRDFHDQLMSSYAHALSGDKHLVQRMYQFWEYFIQLFPSSKKGLKKIKKARSLTDYRAAVRDILQNELA